MEPGPVEEVDGEVQVDAVSEEEKAESDAAGVKELELDRRSESRRLSRHRDGAIQQQQRQNRDVELWELTRFNISLFFHSFGR